MERFPSVADEKACCLVDASQNCLNLCVYARAYEERERAREISMTTGLASLFSAIILAGISAAKGHTKELWEAQQVLDAKRLVF